MRIQYTVRTLLLLPLALAVVLGAWYSWIKPRVEFQRQREASIDALTWSGKTAEDEFRTGQAVAALQRATYKSLRIPVVNYVAFLLGEKPIILVDWIAMESDPDGVGVVLPGGNVIPLRFPPNAVSYAEGTYLYTGVIYPQEHYPDEWKRVAAAEECQVFLMKNGLRISNQVDVRTLGSQDRGGGNAPASVGQLQKRH